MYSQAKKGRSRSITNVNTRSQTKYVFKTDVKIGKNYQKSPYFRGTRLWDGLNKETQDIPCKYMFKRKIESLYKSYKSYNPLYYFDATVYSEYRP